MDITPHTNLLKSLRGERVNYPLLIGEGVDNALDADATSVDVSISENVLRFQDNGRGITRDRIGSLFSLGSHGAMSTTKLGRFGIGIKHQAINAGDVFEVISTSRDGRVRMQVDWKHVLKSGSWRIDDPRWLPTAVGAPTGTVITITDLRRPPKLSLEKIRHEVALQFRPAIADGKQISINGQIIDLLPDPELTDIVEREFALSDGKTARLYGGILVRPSKLSRVHVAYSHRVIMPDSTLGCEGFGGLNKMFARVQISGPWKGLAKFKNDLTDEVEREELEEVIADALRPILEKCNSDSMTARIAQIAAAANEMIAPELQAARPHRATAPAQARERSTKAHADGGIVDSQKSDPGGPARAARPAQDRLEIFFEDGAAEKHGVGRYEPGKVKRVTLSSDHPYIAELMALRDERLIARAILFAAMAIFEHHRVMQEDWENPFGKRIANMLDINEPSRGAANG